MNSSEIACAASSRRAFLYPVTSSGSELVEFESSTQSSQPDCCDDVRPRLRLRNSTQHVPLARSQRFASTRIPSCRSGIAVRAAERWFAASVVSGAGG